MEKKTVTSHDQKGGTTAFEVNVNRASGESRAGRHAPLPMWLRLSVAIATIVGVIIAVIVALNKG